jgi:PAS domain S-box-containing protein
MFLLGSVLGCLGFLMLDGLGSLSPVPVVILLLSTITLGYLEFDIGGAGLSLASTAAYLFGVWVGPGQAILFTSIGLGGSALLASLLENHPAAGADGTKPSHMLGQLRGSARSLFSLTLAMVAYRILGGAPLLSGAIQSNNLPLAASIAALGLVELGTAWVEAHGGGSSKAEDGALQRLLVFIVGTLGLASLGVLALSLNGLTGYAIFSLFLMALVQAAWHAGRTRRRLLRIKPPSSTPSGIPDLGDEAFLPARVYEHILDQAISLLSASRGHLALYKDETDSLSIVAQRPHQPQAVGPGRSLPAPPISVQVAETGQPSRLDRTRRGGPASDGARFVLAAPIQDHAGKVGVLTVEREDGDRFGTSDQVLLTQHANASIEAIRNALLYEELEGRLTEQSLLYQASMQIGETLEPEAVAVAAADSTCVALQADRAAIYRWDPEDEQLICIASVEDGRPQDRLSDLTLYPADLPFLQKCLTERKVQRWCAGNAPSERDRTFLVDERQAACLLVVPLTLGERTLGIIEATTSNPAGFGPSADWTAQSIAFQTAIALENTELYQWTRAGHDRLMAILNSSREGIIMVDLAGKMLLVNKLAGEMIDIDRRQLENNFLDNPQLQLESHLGYEAGDIPRLLDALAHHTTYYARNSIFEIKGTEHTFLQRNDSPVFDSDGELIGWLIVLRDVTEQRELEQSRQHLTEMIVHDLRGPLTAILSGLTLLKTHIDVGIGSPVVGQALTISERSVQQMLGLVDSLLTMSKLEGGSTNLHLERTDPGHIIREIAEIYIAEANKAGIIMQMNLEPVLDVELDREKFARVVGNLIDNALKFTPAGGQINLVLRRLPDHFEFQISDSGPGIPVEYRDKIFDRYAQIPGVSGRRRGTGIGLAFCKLTVEAHGGRIWVDDHQNGGSAFTLRIPFQNPRAGRK